MIKKIIVFILILSVYLLINPYKGNSEEKFEGLKVDKFPFYVFSYYAPNPNFVISGYMGDTQDIRLWKKMEPEINKNCIELIYKPKANSNSKGWVGLYWQYPANNWGDNKKGGYNLKLAKNLFFYARGQEGNEAIEFKIGGINGPYGDSDQVSTGLIYLSKQWTLYKIDLKDFDLRNIIGGFGVIINSPLNPDGVSIFLNDIYFTDKEKPEQGVFLDYSDYSEIQDNIIKEKKGNELYLNISEYENKIFSQNQSDIRQGGEEVLNKVVGMINDETYKRVLIMVNTYDLQSKTIDKELSKKRAEIVYDYFLKKGLDKQKLGYKIFEGNKYGRKDINLNQQATLNKKVEILIIKWKMGEEEKFKYYFFNGYDAFIKENYKEALNNWEEALKYDSENQDLKKRIEEVKQKLTPNNNQ